MKVKSLVPWYGAKRTLAPRILDYFGDHSVYWEPFCGSMAMLLAKPQVRQETVNDLHRDLTNLALVIQDPKLACEFDWRLRRTLCAEGLFRSSLEWLRDEKNALQLEVNPERAYHYFVTSWLGMNGICGTDRVTSSFAKRFTSGGGDGGTRFASAVDSIPAWHDRLRTVMIYNGCGLSICERIEDKEGTLIYCDPPYIEKADEYKHDFEINDHRRLAQALNRFTKTKVVVSYYDHPQLLELYPDWRRVDLEVNKALKNPRKATAERTIAPEVILLNWHEEELPEPNTLFE